MNDLPTLLGALAALVAAVGGIAGTIMAYRAKKQGQENNDAITVIDGQVRVIGERVDGRLSDLLRAEIARALAQGVAQGEQSERDRQAPAARQDETSSSQT